MLGGSQNVYLASIQVTSSAFEDKYQHLTLGRSLRMRRTVSLLHQDVRYIYGSGYQGYILMAGKPAIHFFCWGSSRAMSFIGAMADIVSQTPVRMEVKHGSRTAHLIIKACDAQCGSVYPSKAAKVDTNTLLLVWNESLHDGLRHGIPCKVFRYASKYN